MGVGRLKPSTSKQSDGGSLVSPAAIVSGVLTGMAVSFLGALGLAIAVFFMPLSESGVNMSMNVLQWVGIAGAGLWASRKAGFAGLLHGSLAGLSFVFLLLILGLIIMPGLPDLGLVAKRGLIALGIGAVAGIIGMNLDQ